MAAPISVFTLAVSTQGTPEKLPTASKNASQTVCDGARLVCGGGAGLGDAGQPHAGRGGRDLADFPHRAHLRKGRRVRDLLVRRRR